MLLDPLTVSHAELDGELVTVHTRDAQYLSALSLQELESRLPGDRFARVHRRALVNLEHVVRLEPNEVGGYTARTRGGHAVEVSRQAARDLRKRLGSALRGSDPLSSVGATTARDATMSAMRATTASADSALESISIASSALRSGAAARVESRVSRATISALVCAASTGLPAAASSATRRRARSSVLAVRKNFASASGNTTVPMSRPSTTTPPAAPMRRCSPSSAARTSGSADTRDAPSDISGVRIAVVTSCPFSVTWLTRPFQAERDVDAVGQRRDAGAVIPRDAALARAQRHRPVDRARVEQRVTEPRRQQPRGGRLPRPRRPVDRDDQAWASQLIAWPSAP